MWILKLVYLSNVSDVIKHAPVIYQSTIIGDWFIILVIYWAVPIYWKHPERSILE